jgi:hypothetical protein
MYVSKSKQSPTRFPSHPIITLNSQTFPYSSHLPGTVLEMEIEDSDTLDTVPTLKKTILWKRIIFLIARFRN